MKNLLTSQRQIIPKVSTDLQTHSSNIVRRGLDELHLLDHHLPIRIIHIDDIAETRENVRKLLQFEIDFEIVASTGSSLEAIDIYKELSPDFILQDINRPEMDGITFTREIIKIDPSAKILFLTVQSDLQYLKLARNAGALGRILKPPHVDELFKLLHSFHENNGTDKFFVDSWFWQHHYCLFDNEINVSSKIESNSNRLFLQSEPIIKMKNSISDATGMGIVGNLPFNEIVALDLDSPHIRAIDFELIYQMQNLTSLFIPTHICSSFTFDDLMFQLEDLMDKLPHLHGVYIGEQYHPFNK